VQYIDIIRVFPYTSKKDGLRGILIDTHFNHKEQIVDKPKGDDLL